MDQTCNFTIYQIGNTFITNFVQLITNHSNLDDKKSFQQTKKTGNDNGAANLASELRHSIFF